MATFKWDIHDASDVPTPELAGGEVELKGGRPTGPRAWDISPADGKVELEPLTGGTVGRVGVPTQVVNSASADRAHHLNSLSADRKLFRSVVLVVLVLLGFGFLAVVVNDMRQGKLDFQTYTMFLSSFLAGIGVGKVGNANRTQQGDGSG